MRWQVSLLGPCESPEPSSRLAWKTETGRRIASVLQTGLYSRRTRRCLGSQCVVAEYTGRGADSNHCSGNLAKMGNWNAPLPWAIGARRHPHADLAVTTGLGLEKMAAVHRRRRGNRLPQRNSLRAAEPGLGISCCSPNRVIANCRRAALDLAIAEPPLAGRQATKVGKAFIGQPGFAACHPAGTRGSACAVARRALAAYQVQE